MRHRTCTVTESQVTGTGRFRFLRASPRSFLLTQGFLAARCGNTVITPVTECTGGAFGG